MMKWGLGAAGIAAAGAIAVAALSLGGVASAQEPTDDDQTKSERYQELLAEELGISVDELNEARTAARDKLIDELVESGDITEEQAAKIKELEPGDGMRFGVGRHALGHGVRNAVVSVFETAAEVVGLDTAELRERLAGGESLVDIADSEGIDEATLQSDLVSELTDKINQAVEDGDLDEDRAAMLLENLDQFVERAINADRPFEGRFGHPFERFRMERNQN